MILEWHFILLNDLQQLWDLLVYYFTIPFASKVIQEYVSIFYSSFLQPFILLVVPLFLLLMFGAVVVSKIAFHYDSYREKRNRVEIILSQRQQTKKENSA